MTVRWNQIVLTVATVVACCEISAATAAEPAAPRSASPFHLVQFPPREKPQKHSYTDSGIVSGVAANSIAVVAIKTLWVIYPQPGCVVDVTGEAEAGYLKPGMFVRLYGEFDKRYKSVAPVKQLQIFSPLSPQAANLALGVFPDTLPPVDEKDKDKQAEEKPKEESAGVEDSEKKAAEGGTPMMVVGRLNAVRDGELFVTAGNRNIRAPLAEDAEIRVLLADFRLAQRGDAIKFRSEYYEKGTAFAKELTIELTIPLEAPKRPMRKPVAKQPVKAGNKTK